MAENIRTFKELRVYQSAMDTAMKIYEITKTFPAEEKYSLVDQIRRSSRSVCANIAEAWRKRRYKAAFIAKLSDAESEASETQVWLEFAAKSNYIQASLASEIESLYEHIIAQIVLMIRESHKWIIKTK